MRQGFTSVLRSVAVLFALTSLTADAQAPSTAAAQPQAATSTGQQVLDSAKQSSSNALSSLVQSAGAGLQVQPAAASLSQWTPSQTSSQFCNPWSKNATNNGCVAPQVCTFMLHDIRQYHGNGFHNLRQLPDLQAGGACPLQCTDTSPAGCSERFLCWEVPLSSPLPSSHLHQ